MPSSGLPHFPGSCSPDAVHVSCVLVTCLAVTKYPRKQLKEERVYSVLQFQRIQSIMVVTAGWQKQEVTLYPQPETEDHRMLDALLPGSVFTVCGIVLAFPTLMNWIIPPKHAQRRISLVILALLGRQSILTTTAW